MYLWGDCVRYKKHKEAQKLLLEINANPSKYYVIHYSCESFYDITDGRTPRITSIAIRNYDTAQTDSFSIHKVAEKKHIALPETDGKYDELEKQMLCEYFDYLEKHGNDFFLHWNMRDMNFGFKAIEHRYEVLSGTVPYRLSDNQKIDISRLFINKYGVAYIGHPRLENLLKKNHIEPNNFMGGAYEAQAFKNKEYIKLHQSTLSKADAFANLIDRAANNTLKTNAKWKEIYGFSVNGILEFLRANWWGQLILFVIATAIGILAGKLL